MSSDQQIENQIVKTRKYVNFFYHVRTNIDFTLKNIKVFKIITEHNAPGVSVMSGTFLDHVRDIQTGLCDYCITLSGFMIQNIQKYIKIDHDDRNIIMSFIEISI